MIKRLVLLSLLVLCTACGDAPPQRLIRLGSLMETGAAEAVILPAGTAVAGAAPYQTQTGLSAARVARLRLRARGDASLATFTWRLAQDPREPPFPAFRTLSFPVVPDGQEHVYTVDLEREAYWTGQVEALRVSVDRGRLDLLEITAVPAASPYRSMSLRGESLPALPGLARLEIDLPKDLPSGAVFEARLGLVPEFDRPRTRAVFRARLADAAGEPGEPWLEETVEGAKKGSAGWRDLSRPLPDGAAGKRLILEAEATLKGAKLPEGVALWGDPVLVTPGDRPGPNLVVILVDTLRADVLGSYGDPTGITPRLDTFARQSVRFADLSAPAPWTLPSVSSLMTGLQPQTHGAGIRYGDFAPTGLSGGVRTLAETLGDSGFYNIGVYHNIYVNPAFGLQQGFDEYVSLEDRAGVLVDDALARLRRVSPDRRFFLYLHVFDPHNPYEPPAEECQSVARRLLPGYRGSLGCSADRRPELPIPPLLERRWYHALYRAEVAYTDRQIGRLLDGLDEMGLDDDTVVLIVSDHGEEFWTRRFREQSLGYESNSDHGHTLYRELLYVPALLRVPGRDPGVVEGPAEMVDLFPTLLRLVGVEPPPNEGQDLAPRLDGGPPAQRPTQIADVILHGPSRWAIRRGPWKLVVPRQEGMPVELYDLEGDPGESRDLSGARPEVVAALRELGERTLAQRQRERARYRAGDESLGATYLEWNHITKLRSLGYLK